MNSFRFVFLAILSTSLLAGCASSTKMSLGSDLDTVNVATTPIFLMTATFKNRYRTLFQPKLGVVNVEKLDTKNDAESITFEMDEKALDEKDTPEYGNRYLLRMGLSAGDYKVRGFTGYSGVFPIHGTFFASLNNADIKSLKPGVYYLGHVSATMRERNEGEERAGSILPLLDQAATGFSGGTFDIEVSDRLDADLPELMAKFPALRSATIQKALITQKHTKNHKYPNSN